MLHIGQNGRGVGMYSIVLMVALTGAPEAPAFEGPWATPGWPCYFGQCKEKIYGTPYSYSGTYTFYAGYYSVFGISQFPMPLVPGTMGYLASQSGEPANYKVLKPNASSPARTAEPPVAPVSPVVIPQTNIKIAPSGQRAEVIVEIPEGTTLYVNGSKIGGKSGKRSFTTPILPSGNKHFYDFKWEVTTNNGIQVMEKTIEVKAGEVQTVRLEENKNTNVAKTDK
jgi:uncharacterized protein (TIGR03000 family)